MEDQKKCKHCAMMIPKEAKICPHCRKKQGINKLVIIIPLFLLAIWWMMPPSFDSYKEKAKNNPTPAVTSTQAKPTAWEYGSSKDEMSGKVRKYATKESINSVNFEFPYHGEQRGTIMITNNGVLFYVKKGQVICQGSGEYGTCLVRVKFDEEKDKYVSARKSGDDSTTIKFTSNSFLKQLKQSKKIMIQPEVFHNGLPVFTFNISGLDPNY